MSALFWEQRCLIEMLAQPITDGPHETPNLVKRGIPFISVEAVMNNRLDFTRKRGFISSEYNDQCNKKYKPQLHDVYLVKSGSTVGKVAIVETNMVFNIWSPLAAMRVNEFNNAYFLYYLLQTDNLQDQIKKKSKGGTQPNLSMRILEKCITNSTNLKEETQIALILNKVDKLLLLQQRKLKQLKFIKKAMVQKLFTTKNVPNLRFKGFNSNWEQRKLKEISTKCVKKNKDSLNLPVLTNSAIQGIVFQAQFFDKSIAKKINNYYLVRPDDFVYNPRISNNAPFGPIRRNKLSNIGVMSPLYYVFSLKDKVNKDFMEYYFMSSRWHRFMYKNGDSGARSDRFSIKDDIFKNMPIIIPTMKEQEKIGAFLKMLNHYIDLQQDKISKLQTYKRFLLQNMFI